MAPINYQDDSYTQKLEADFEYVPELPRPTKEKEREGEKPFWVGITTYLSYAILVLVGHVKDFLGKIFYPQNYVHLAERDGYAPLNSDFESFYTRHIYGLIRDCWNRPITGVPGREVTLLERETPDYCKTFKLTGKKVKVLNLSSYNYLGFAQSDGPCADAVEKSLIKYGVSNASSRMAAGTQAIHKETEELVARYLRKPAAIVFSMGFATNSTTLPALIGKGSLLISDELNHASLVTGARNSGAQIRVFKHNDIEDLEECLREAISQGMPKTHRPWKKILVVVEGLYSMEGTICQLPAIVALKDKYKFYLYVDEAHSIGALGKTGRGVCEYWGISPDKVDILMGTFTKSFGSAGGYIAGSKELINHLKTHAHSPVYAESMSPIVCQQIISSMKIIMGEDGTDDGQRRIKQLAQNGIYLRNKLKEMGFIVYGDDGSPIVPLMLFNSGKLPGFSREMLKRNIAVVVVGYPATPIAEGRVRFCLSASHTREDMDFALKAISEVGDLLVLKLAKHPRPLPQHLSAKKLN